VTAARWRWLRRPLLLLALTAGLLALPAGIAAAHPLGNFTVSTASGLRLAPDELVVDQVADLAEIPTFQARPELDRDGDGKVSGGEADAWAQERCRVIAGGADARLDGRRLALAVTASRASTSPGSGGLDVLRLECRLRAPTGRLTGAGGHTLQWRSTAYADRVGWHEVTAAGDGVTLTASDVPATSPSARLTSYPKDLIDASPAVRQATVSFRPGGARLAGGQPEAAGPAVAGPVDGPARALTRVLTERSGTAGGLLLAVGLAVVLGALHAVAPGHGKTVMAAYLVGLRGTVRDAAVIGATVTLTHTAGVLALGLLLGTARALAPERLYPWLGIVSGLLLAVLGVGVLRRLLRDRHAGADHHHHGHHHHGPGHDHGDGDGHGHGHEHGTGQGRPRPRDLVTLGFAGGLAPSPSALVVLLAATALGQAWLGVVLVLAYGAGMALTLSAAGLLLVRARGPVGRWRARRSAHWPWLGRAARIAPAGTAGLIMLGGLGLALRSASGLWT
jgi:nickel/cobalt exporter